MAPDDTRLSEIGVGESATVKSVRNARRIALRLLELGLLPGTRVTVLRRAPMGDPIELRLRDFSLSIRAEEAALVCVTRLEPGASPVILAPAAATAARLPTSVESASIAASASTAARAAAPNGLAGTAGTAGTAEG